MAETAHPTGSLTVDPPLAPRERSYLRRLHRSAEGRAVRPGWHCPWAPSEDGTELVVPMEFGTKEPLAEWAAYLTTHLLGPGGADRHGRALKGFSYDHRLLGEVTVQGRTRTDRWTLRGTTDGLVVERTTMPCAWCWAETLLMVRPTVAYRFIHPVRAANLVDGRFPELDPKALEPECDRRAWTPERATVLPVTWPLRRSFYDSWWIDTDAFPDAQPFRWHEEDQRDADVIDLFGA